MKAPGIPTGLVSVIVPCVGTLESTRRCLAALARHTRPSWELIAVHAGSPGIATYLAGVAGAAPFRVEVVASPEVREFPAGCNRGVAAARGGDIVLLADDVVVTDGWLDQLIALVKSDPAIGMSAPMSNAAPPHQRVEPDYAHEDSLARFAAHWRESHRGQWFTADVLGGPCLLVKRQALEAAGVWAASGLGEDLDSRVRRAGFSTAVAHDLYVHRGPWPDTIDAPSDSGKSGRIVPLALAAFVRRYGDPDTARALCAYTPAADTHAVLTLLAHARPHRILEVGTALGHMTANLTEWSPEDAQVVSVGTVRGMYAGGAPEQSIEAPDPEDLGRHAGHFGKGHKAQVIAADTRGVDFARLGPFDFAFIDGGHDLDQALHDSRAAYAALEPGGWLVWHDVGHPAPWIRVSEAIEVAGFAEPVEHVAGTMVAFLRKGAVAGAARDEPPRLVWEGDIDGLHSLGLINRSLCKALIRRGVDLGIVTEGVAAVTPERLAPEPSLEVRHGRMPVGGPPHVWVAHRWPPRLDPPPEGQWAFYQPWEYGSLPRAWLTAARRADEVWAYSRSVRDVYLDAGLPEGRVHVVPLGIDPEVFRPGLQPAPLPPGPGFRFLFVGGTIRRKGIDLLLAAYGRAFRPADGVGLIVQDMGSRSFYRGQTAGAAIAALRDRGYPVEHREEPLSPEGLAGLYAACDCVVQPYRGEGFALPVAEAMACGLPVIVTGGGPALDYASEETAYLVPARRLELPSGRAVDLETVGRAWVWEPDIERLSELMTRVVSDPASARARGEAAARSIRGRFTWAQAAGAVEARLEALRKPNA